MADPVSITGLVLQVGVLVKQLVEYGKAAKGAHGEIAKLRTELYALNGVLQDIESAQEDAGKRPMKRELTETLTTASAILSELARKLDGTTHRKLKSLIWPFEKSECNELLGRLERVKTWLMLYSMGEQQAGINLLQDGLEDLTVTVKADIASREARSKLDEQQALLDVLSSPSSDAVHSKACSAWDGATPGSWLLDGHLRGWLSEARPADKIVLLNGVSGSGKTIMMSRAAEWTRSLSIRNAKPLVAGHYCSYNDESSQKSSNVLSSLVAQLARYKPSILDHLYSEPTKEAPPAVEQLEKCIANAASDSLVVLFIDALNESTDRAAICQSIARITANCVDIRLLVSSTPGASDLTGDGATCLQVDMAADRSTPDMLYYIDECISKSKVLQRLPRGEVQTALLAKANGSFRWLELQMQYIATQPTPRRAMQAIENTPSTLDAAYAAVFSRIQPESRGMVREALAWVAFASRPLTLTELNEAVVIEDDQKDIDDDYRLVPQDILLTTSQGLLSWDPLEFLAKPAHVGLSPRYFVVKLAHQSVLAYLIGDASRHSDDGYWHLDKEQCSRGIIRKCLTYILMPPLQFYAQVGKYDTWRRIDESYPFTRFAGRHWIVHVLQCGRLGPQEVELVTRVLKAYLCTEDDYNRRYGKLGICVRMPHVDRTDIVMELRNANERATAWCTWNDVVASQLEGESAFDVFQPDTGLCQVLNLVIRSSYDKFGVEAVHLADHPGATPSEVRYTFGWFETSLHVHKP